MPIYEYRCERGHTFEVMQRMSDEPVAACQECSAPVQRVFHPVAVHFKGSGFYNTDYGTRKRAREKAEGGSGADASSGSDSASKGTSDSKTDSTGDSKKSSDSKSSSSSKASSKAAD
jgi:putative FmdB family regulatory protein